MKKNLIISPLFIVLTACIVCLSSFKKLSCPAPVANVFSIFKLGTPVKEVNKFFAPGFTSLSNGGKARKFNRSFAALGDAVVSQGVVVSHNDTIRTLLLQVDSVNGKKLWKGMVDLYGMPQSPDVLDANEWIINQASFAMYELYGTQHALYRDIEYFKKRKLKTCLLSEIDHL